MNLQPRIIFSGMQPSGRLHIGNYLGALKQWVEYQDLEGKRLFCVVDLHAMTSRFSSLREYSLFTVASYIACGINPDSSIIFLQSDILEHAALSWLLACITPLGWLNKMTQYKIKSNQKNENLGLYAYPVLMAADILLYRSTHVPVGEDQVQHLELARFLAKSFNSKFDSEVFQVPEIIIPKTGAARVMSLTDATAKMSKTSSSENSCIYLDDSPDDIIKKINKAKTDSIVGFSGSLNERPEAKNLINIYSALTNHKHDFNDFASLKKGVAEALIEALRPIRAEFFRLIADFSFLDKILISGAEKARSISCFDEVSRILSSI